MEDLPSKRVLALLKRYDKAVGDWRKALDEAAAIKDEQLELLVELTVFRPVSIYQATKTLGYKSHEVVGKRVRPIYQEYGLTPSQGRVRDVPPEDGWTGGSGRWVRRWAGPTTAQLTRRLAGTPDRIAAAENKARRIFRKRALPPAVELVDDFNWPAYTLTHPRHEGGPKREMLRNALHWYRCQRDGDADPQPVSAGSHRPSMW
jgi:hypothetical protein